MKSILTELYNGSVFPAEQVFPRDPEYRHVNCGIEKVRQQIIDSLSDGDQQLFEELENLHCQSNYIEAAEIFACGFRLAALMMVEVYSKSSSKE